MNFSLNPCKSPSYPLSHHLSFFAAVFAAATTNTISQLGFGLQSFVWYLNPSYTKEYRTWKDYHLCFDVILWRHMLIDSFRISYGALRPLI
ncbi:hypothetical protein L2E82_33165 [Cichorium intybus]|uniref:Uncharacterized protein n=1 Tax=Cichorium intybus TaxID=13427 RepID=A0ACB9BJH7_CICIN|nr:hypothetical protein L2E82_33165 [Cichorium intybus]